MNVIIPPMSDIKLRGLRLLKFGLKPTPDEAIDPLIEDAWKVIECDINVMTGCTAEFEDPNFSRDSLYYVRAIEEPTLTVNGATSRTTFDEKGNAIDVDICYGDYRTELSDNFLAPAEHRAWSSPIYINLNR